MSANVRAPSLLALVVIAAVAFAWSAGTSPAYDIMGTGALPDAPARQLVIQNCMICHSAQIITSQRLAPKTWLAEVNKMIKYGAPVKDADKQAIADYLAASFPVNKPPSEPESIPVP